MGQSDNHISVSSWFAMASLVTHLIVPSVLPAHNIGSPQIVIGSLFIKPMRKWVQEEQKLPEEEEGGSLPSSSGPPGSNGGDNRVGGTNRSTEPDSPEGNNYGVAPFAVAGVQSEVCVDAAPSDDKSIPKPVAITPPWSELPTSPEGVIAEGGSRGATGGAVAPLS